MFPKRMVDSLTPQFLAWVIFLLGLTVWSGSEIPAPRLARPLPPQASEAHERRARHNDALRQLFAETGIPTGSDASNIMLRTRAVELINYAITNRIELADGSATADQIAEAADDYSGRYVRGETNTSAELMERARREAFFDEPTMFGFGNPPAPQRSRRPARLCDTNPSVLVLGDSHAACLLPHGSVDSWIIADLLDVPASNRLAVSGATAAQWATNQGGWLTAATNNRAPVIWISLGGNDAMAALADGRVTPDEARAAASNYYAVVRAVARGRRLVVATAYADPYQGARSDYAIGLLILNSAIRLQTMRACNELGVPFNILEEPDVLGFRNYDGSGDLHPDAAGYTNMALRLRDIIKESLQ